MFLSVSSVPSVVINGLPSDCVGVRSGIDEWIVYRGIREIRGISEVHIFLSAYSAYSAVTPSFEFRFLPLSYRKRISA